MRFRTATVTVMARDARGVLTQFTTELLVYDWTQREYPTRLPWRNWLVW